MLDKHYVILLSVVSKEFFCEDIYLSLVCVCTFSVVVDHNRYHSFDICMTIYLNLKNAESEKLMQKMNAFG